MERTCRDCRHSLKNPVHAPCENCTFIGKSMFVPMINADYIRSLSDEELAEYAKAIKENKELKTAMQKSI